MPHVNDCCILCVVTDIAEEHRAWLIALMQKTKLPISTLATNAGLAATTLSRFLKDPDYSSGLSARTVESLCRAYNVPPPGSGGFEEDDARPWKDGDPRAVVEKLSVGAATDIWRVASNSLEFAGYRTGDYLVVDLNARPEPGDIVIAQRYDWKADKAETLLRIYEPPFLVGASAAEAARKPIYIDEKGNVVIKGVVLASYRLKPAA